MTKIEAETIRAYYNAGNDNEPFCVDFGPGTLSIVCSTLFLKGEGTFCFASKSDPKAWIEYHAHTLFLDINAGYVGVYPSEVEPFSNTTHQNSVTE